MYISIIDEGTCNKIEKSMLTKNIKSTYFLYVSIFIPKDLFNCWTNLWLYCSGKLDAGSDRVLFVRMSSYNWI